MGQGKADKTIIVAPHPDDEVYGCSSFLIGDPKHLTVVYVTQDHPLFPGGQNLEENSKLVGEIGFTPIYMRHSKRANILDRVSQSDLIWDFEILFNEQKPDTVLLPAPSYNQDHRAVYDAALTAMRPHDRNWYVNRILVYEQPETFGTLRKPDPFRANYYRPLDIDRKIAIMAIYQTQLRGHRTPEHVRAIGLLRGMQANMEYAEAFEVLRWIE